MFSTLEWWKKTSLSTNVTDLTPFFFHQYHLWVLYKEREQYREVWILLSISPVHAHQTLINYSERNSTCVLFFSIWHLVYYHTALLVHWCLKVQSQHHAFIQSSPSVWAESLNLCATVTSNRTFPRALRPLLLVHRRRTCDSGPL